MTDPLEVLYWHDMNAIKQTERSNESFKARRRSALVERRPAPLNMSAQEMWDWIEEMRPEINWQEADVDVIAGVYLTVPEIGRAFGKTLKDAVCLAAAKWKRINDEI